MMSPIVTKKYNLTSGSQDKRYLALTQRTYNSCQILHEEILTLSDLDVFFYIAPTALSLHCVESLLF